MEARLSHRSGWTHEHFIREGGYSQQVHALRDVGMQSLDQIFGKGQQAVNMMFEAAEKQIEEKNLLDNYKKKQDNSEGTPWPHPRQGQSED
ncbi:MAG: hypothetical protein FWD89_01065 [Firmicutes bacterium]|nr:hypothetical protein [Bacillota bacterium]